MMKDLEYNQVKIDDKIYDISLVYFQNGDEIIACCYYDEETNQYKIIRPYQIKMIMDDPDFDKVYQLSKYFTHSINETYIVNVRSILTIGRPNQEHISSFREACKTSYSNNDSIIIGLNIENNKSTYH